MDIEQIPYLPNDVLISIALELNLPTLLNLCRSSRRFNRLTCDSYIFWFNKLQRDYGFTYKGDKNLKKIKEFYREIKEMSAHERLMEASRLGDLNAVVLSLEQGADFRRYGDLAKFASSQRGHTNIVKYLEERESALEEATKRAYPDIIKYLTHRI